MVEIASTCEHCGQPLAVVRVRGISVLAGLDDLEYVHAGTGSLFCEIRYEAKPYDAWRATREYRAALAAGATQEGEG